MAGDFVYLDPPYLGTSGFFQYKSLSVEEHIELAEWATEMTEKGVMIMASNSAEADCIWDRRVWHRHNVQTRYSSNNYALKEQLIKKELLVTNY